ncbi:glycosyltransferase family 4 protein [Mesoflavibacter zeaxanthinifaciens]|uniref:glycosyltransferase family 4 protein n=1 Tax=Mesoflavibacter zeaxanthinifaciens TaxID=393060 RepID=UPI000485232D|nr:glycosyltransferase family 4 protein [Mesoflavibacter zeaxanthinifaciens]
MFFFPYYHTGGAERVHLNIVKALEDKTCVVIFTHASATTHFLEAFKSVSETIEVNSILNKKSEYLKQTLFKVLAKAIQKGPKTKVFGCNTKYYYQFLPFLHPTVNAYDLLHALAEDDERVTELVNSASRIHTRVAINKKAKQDLETIYNQYHLKEAIAGKIKIIPNGIVLPSNSKPKSFSPIKIGFIGRWSEEKRPELFLNIAMQVKKNNPEVEFYMAGTGMKAHQNQIKDAGVVFLGNIKDENQLNSLYQDLNILIICSVYEGFPMVMMESMPYQVIPICTDVGGINEHIVSDENGFLIEGKIENELIEAFISKVNFLITNKEQMMKIGLKAQHYAKENFCMSNFKKKYFNLLK